MEKPGWQTTEFWITILSTLIGALVLSGVIGQGEADSWLELLAPLLNALVPAVYIWSRTKVKIGGGNTIVLESGFEKE